MLAQDGDDSAVTRIADACFAYLVNDTQELARFMALSGYDAQALRQALDTPELTLALLNYFAANEQTLLAMCANAQIAPAAFARALSRLDSQA